MATDIESGSSNAKQPPATDPQLANDTHQVPSEGPSSNAVVARSMSPAVAHRLQKKNREWESAKRKGAPLTLLDLPADVLRLIVKEYVQTNDLTALAMTHSALYKLAMPNIYSRFDIVWPDNTTPAESSKNVDALSYGLTTLCLPSKFAEKTRSLSRIGAGRREISRRLANNNHAHYVRKFSIGNGPVEWTSDYLISKESGKLLGTLVAIAVSKMINLESFVWDMPTGVLSDIFMALSSIGDETGQAKLEKVWVRWHDNWSRTLASPSTSSSTASHPPPPPHPPPAHVNPQVLPVLLPGAISTSVGVYIPNDVEFVPSFLNSYAESSVEYPTFSILPPLKSLTVLDIDEISYLDEMSVLIERSAVDLRELQVGISKRVYHQDFVQPWDGANLHQVDHNAKWPGESQIPFTRLGGVLGVLVGRVYDIHKKVNLKRETLPSDLGVDPPGDVKTEGYETKGEKTARRQSTTNHEPNDSTPERKRLEGKLKLHKLSLERVSLSIAVCLRAIDWSNMTSLTILNCKYHEALWKALKRQFQPTTQAHGALEAMPPRYHMALKHLHTDQASPELISFLKEVIAPNTMETIFLQDRQRTTKPSVTLEQVFKSTVKRHPNSLRKLLIDSSDRNPPSPSIPSGRWKHWVIKDQFLSYIISGRMKGLKELGIMIDFKDWHTFVRQLPQLANLRALYIPRMLNNREGRSLPLPEELALHLVDIISLRREIRLAYVGLWHKCFEITEVTHGDSANSHFRDDDIHIMSVDDNANGMDGHGEGDDETEDEDEDEDDDEGNNALIHHDDDNDDDDESLGETSNDGASETDSLIEAAALTPRLRLNEIMYCDDRVGIFQARHGKL